MRHQGLKISSSGQELGGDLLFHRRLGFSGTPSDLLPLELGKCAYERGTDGLVLHFLTSSRIMSTFTAPQDWTVKGLLNKIATADPPYNALIDTGALITGMSNYEVAAYLLCNGLPWAQGVVFLDSSDKKMILCRDGMRIVPLATGSVGKEQRFAFYDQVHTTGMDIQHAPNAKAVLTLGKDMTFRDFAQGAFRMRGIGKGQTIELFIIPEVLKLVSDNLKSVGIHVTGQEDTVTMCKNVSAWLNINSCRSEGVQFNMLCEQNLRSVWRKVAFRRLSQHHATVGTESTTVELDDAVDVFRERLDFNVEASVPPVGNFGQRIDKLVTEHQKFIGDLEEAVIAHVRLLATYTKEEGLKPIAVEGSKGTTNADAQSGGDGVSASQTVAFNSEQQQEQEQEQEQTKEQEQLVQVELEEEAQIEGEEVPNKKKFSVKKQDTTSWNFEHLAQQSSMEGKFYPCSNFEVYKEVSSLLSTKKDNKKLQFPPYLMMSENYFHRLWTMSSHRRLKNITVILEWIPSVSQIKLVPNSELEGVYDAPDRSQRLMRTFALHDANRDGSLNEAEIKSFSQVVNPLLSSVEELNEYARQLSPSLNAPMPDVDKFMKSGSFMKVHKGRYYVAVELAEAESIRAIMHIRENSPIISGSDCQLALRVGPTLLDESKGFVRSPVIQTAVARQCFRFIDSDHYFDADAFGYMLNALHFSPPELRALFYDEVRTCRRRMQKDWNLTTVSKVIKTPDEYHHFEFESLIAAARVAIRNAGLKLLDAYRLFDLNHDGLLNCSELYSGLLWAGMKEIKPDMVTSLVKHIDKTKDGRVRYRDFLIALNDPNELEEFVPQQVIKRPFAHFCYLKYCSSLQFLYLQQELDLTKIVIPLVEMAEIYSPPAEKSKQQVLIPLSITVSLYSISFYRLIFVSAST
jgi:Ca2+-binding EF-hand superfamily protein